MKIKRILALLGVIILIGLYVVTFITSMMDGALAESLFRASIVCTVIIPALLYAYSFIYRLLKERKSPSDSDKKA